VSTKIGVYSSKKTCTAATGRVPAIPLWNSGFDLNVIMAVRKQIFGAGLLLFFAFVVLSSSYLCADGRPAGVYQRGSSRSGHRSGVGRTAARNFKAGFLVAKNDSSKLEKNLDKHVGSTHAVRRLDRIARITNALLPSPTSFVRNLSPVLNL
jgi:hypothetical protein